MQKAKNFNINLLAILHNYFGNETSKCSYYSEEKV